MRETKEDHWNIAAFVVAFATLVVEIVVGRDQLQFAVPWREVVLVIALLVALTALTLKIRNVARHTGFRTLKTFLSDQEERVLADSLFGRVTRPLIAIGAGVALGTMLHPFSRLIPYRWLVATCVATATWLGLSLASLNSRSDRFSTRASETFADLERRIALLQDIPQRVAQSEKELSHLPGLLDQVTDLERMMPQRYPPRDVTWHCPLAEVFDSPSRYRGINVRQGGGTSYSTTASCDGINRRAIYEHPPREDDALIEFEIQAPDDVTLALLTFYTGIMDLMRIDERLEKSTFKSRPGNKIRFRILLDDHSIFETIRDSFEWRFHTVFLRIPRDRRFHLRFCTNALGQPHCNWAVWGEPCLEDWGTAVADVMLLRASVELLSRHAWEYHVFADQEEGVNTGLYVHQGQLFSVVAVGRVSIDRGSTWMDPSGTVIEGPGQGGKARVPDTHFAEEDGRGPIGALLGWIGEDRDTSSFLVGKQYLGPASRSGYLHLGVNDTQGCYSDNTNQVGEPSFFLASIDTDPQTGAA